MGIVVDFKSTKKQAQNRARYLQAKWKGAKVKFYVGDREGSRWPVMRKRA